MTTKGRLSYRILAYRILAYRVLAYRVLAYRVLAWQALASLVLAGMAMPAWPVAAEPVLVANKKIELDIPPQPLSSALLAFSRQSSIPLAFADEQTDGLMTPGVRGHYAPMAALQMLLQKSGLGYEISDENTVLIVPVATREQKDGQAAPVRNDVSGGPDARSEASGFVLEEIIVTAQKRAERIQDIPVSITALGGEELKSRQIFGLEDLRFAVPNLYIERALGATTTSSVYMRGLGQINPSFFFDAPVPIYSDGVYYARAAGALVDLFDIERVEVLRGPQGTLYGRNASGGAIRIITRTPPLEEMDAAAELSFGSRDQINSRLSFGAPLVPDKVGLRLSFMTRDNDGYMTNLTDGAKAYEDDIIAGRGSLLFNLGSETALTLRGDFMRDRSDQPGASSFVNDADNDPFTFESNFSDDEDFNNVDTGTVAATLETAFGNVSLTAISAYRTVNQKNAADGDGRAIPGIFENQGQELDEWQLTQEIYLSGDELAGAPLKWVIGAFYFRESNDFSFRLRILPFIPANTQIFNQDTHAVGIYGQGTYALTERLNLTGGLRYSHDKKDFIANQFLENGDFNPDFFFEDDFSVSKVDWRLALDYRLAEDISAYVSSGTGFRAGGFNGNALTREAITDGAIKTEEVFNIEGGIKTEWFDRRLRLNATYYYQEYTNLQREILTAQGISNRNFTVDVHGVELELAAIPVEGLELFASLGTISDSTDGLDTDLPRAADYKFQLGFTYVRPVPALAGSLRIGSHYSYTDDYFLDDRNQEAIKVDSFGLLDASVGYEADDGRWAVSLEGLNLTDEVYNLHAFNIPGLVSIRVPSLPRRWLATVRLRF